MIAKSLLDTDIVSEYLKGHDPVVAANASHYVRLHGAFTFTTVTVHEIVFGLKWKDAQVQLRRARLWFDRNEIITPSAEDYDVAAEIRATARKQGNPLQLPDALIAAVAVRFGCPLVTGNTPISRLYKGPAST